MSSEFLGKSQVSWSSKKKKKEKKSPGTKVTDKLTAYKMHQYIKLEIMGTYACVYKAS